MSGRAAVLTPASASTLSRVPGVTSPYYTTPASKRLSVVLTPISANASGDAPKYNDDEKERRERRRSRLMQLHQQKLASPGTPTDRSRTQQVTAPLSGLSNMQLAEHYANCIKLSTENKINSKNAFGLHLIDYLADMVKKKEMNNFQVASSTLDASAKIYAGRVDAIHSETYKVLTGLGQGMDRSQDEAAVGDDAESTGDQDGATKRKRARKSKTIGTNLKNITVNKFDIEFEVDPLFKKTSAAFDEGGVGGLLLNHLSCLNDKSELVLDSTTIAYGLETPDYLGHTDRISIKDLKSLVNGVKLDSLKICPSFADFEFSKWNLEGQTYVTSMAGMRNKDKVFDLEAEAEPIPDLHEDEGFGPEASQLGADDFAPDDDDPGGEEMISGGPLIINSNDKESEMVQSAMNKIVEKDGTVGVLMKVLATEPGEYSYFDSNLMRMWAGPSHWKLRVNIKDKLNPEEEQEEGKKKEKKLFELDFDDEMGKIDRCFRETRAATTLAKSTLDKYCSTQTTLPENLHYNVETLLKLFAKPKLMVKGSRPTSDGVDENIENYDYDNANDRENFVGGVQDDDDDYAGFEGQDATVGFGDTVMSTQDMTAEGTGLNDSLVAQPKRVDRIEIGYAKTAKKFDVKKFKQAIWNMLTKPPGETPGDTPDAPGGSPSPSKGEKRKHDEDTTGANSGVVGTHSFAYMCNVLPNMMSKNMARNISVPIAFVSLLHLANEKTLNLQNVEDMSDLQISQG